MATAYHFFTMVQLSQLRRGARFAKRDSERWPTIYHDGG